MKRFKILAFLIIIVALVGTLNVLPVHAPSGIAFVQVMDIRASCNLTCTITPSSGTIAGDFLIVGVAVNSFPPDIPVISDSQSNAYIPVAVLSAPGGTPFEMVVYVSPKAASITSITITAGASAIYRAFLAEYSGVQAMGNYYANPQLYNTLGPNTSNPSATLGMGNQPHSLYASYDWMIGIFGSRTDPGTETIQTGVSRLANDNPSPELFFGDNNGNTVSFTTVNSIPMYEFGMELEGANPTPVTSTTPVLNAQANAGSCKYPSATTCANSITVTTTGDTLIYVIRKGQAGAAGIPTDTFGDTWTQVNIVQSADAGCDKTVVFTTTTLSSGSNTITFTSSASNSYLGELLDFSGAVSIGAITTWYGLGMTSTSCSNGGSDTLSNSENMIGGITKSSNSWNLGFTGYSGAYGGCPSALSPAPSGMTYFTGMSASTPFTDCNWTQEMIGGYIPTTGGKSNFMFWRDIHWNVGYEHYFDVSIEVFVPTDTFRNTCQYASQAVGTPNTCSMVVTKGTLPDLPPFPLAYWKLDEGSGTSLASSSNPNTLTITHGASGAWLSGASCKFLGCYNFAGTDKAFGTLSPNVIPTELSVAAWVKINAGIGPVFCIENSKGAAGGECGNSWAFGLWAGCDGYAGCPNQPTHWVVLNSGVAWHDTGVLLPSAGAFHQVTLTVHNAGGGVVDQITLYVDGVQVYQTNDTSSGDQTTLTMAMDFACNKHVAQCFITSGATSNIVLDDVAVFSRAISQSEITALQTSSPSLAPLPSGIITWSTDSGGAFYVVGTNTVATTCTLGAYSSTATYCQLDYRPASIGSGTHTLTATYSGDSLYSAGSATTTVTVTQGSVTLSLSCTFDKLAFKQGGTYPCKATVTAGVGGTAPTGTVTFTALPNDSIFTPSSGQCTLSGSSNVATCTVQFTPTSVTNYIITATYAGDTNYLAASPATFIMHVLLYPSIFASSLLSLVFGLFAVDSLVGALKSSKHQEKQYKKWTSFFVMAGLAILVLVVAGL